MHPDNPVARFFAAPARVAALVAGWWLLGLAALTCVEIVGRKFAGFSLQGVDEIGAYTLAAFSTLSLTWALLARAHTRVDFLLGRMPPLLRAVLNATAYATLGALAVYAAWRGWAVLEESLEFQAHANSPLQTPLWLPQSVWLAGLVLFALTAAAMGLHAIWLLLRDRDHCNRLYGPLTLEEEIATEAAGVLPPPDARA